MTENNNKSNNKIEIIKSRLQEAFEPTKLQVIDESDDHIGHAGHQGGGRHFAIEISADVFAGVSKIAAHRQIYAVLGDMIPDEIHALRIKIIS